MPSSREHALIGGGTALFFCALDKAQMNQPLSLGEAIGRFLLGAIGGQLPDIIEPPTNPSHRSFFHSWVSLGVLAELHRRVRQSNHLSHEERDVFSVLIVAMASHIIADNLTPKGVPFIGL